MSSAADGTREAHVFKTWGFSFLACSLISTLLHLAVHTWVDSEIPPLPVETKPEMVGNLAKRMLMENRPDYALAHERLYDTMIGGIRTSMAQGGFYYKKFVDGCPDKLIKSVSDKLSSQGFDSQFKVDTIYRERDICSIVVGWPDEP